MVTNNIQKQIIERLSKGVATKAELAKSFDVSITAITSHINELKEKGYLLEESTKLYTGGRNPKILKLNTEGKFAFGISFSEKQIRVILINLGKKLVAERRYVDTFLEFEDYLKKGRELLCDIINEYKIQSKSIISVTISIPGPINRKTEVIEYLNFGFKNIPFSLIEEYFPNSYIENEANLSLVYEKYVRKIDENNIIIYLGFNEGLGAGIYNHNSFLQSNIGYAGEIGNIIIDYKNHICAEDIVSYQAILAKYNELSDKKIDDINDFIESAEKNDPIALKITDEIYDVLMVALQNVNMILDPGYIIVGGKMTRLLKRINKISEKDELIISSRNFKSQTRIIYSENKNSTTLGAALYGLNVKLGQTI